MIQRTIHGLPFQVHSPSSMTLIAFDDDSEITSVHAQFMGRMWELQVLMKAGHTVRRTFASLADLCLLLDSRRVA